MNKQGNDTVDIDMLETVTDFSKTINGASSLRLFKKIEAKHPKAKAIHVTLEDAKIVLHYLSGYSPNLNSIGRLWKFFKKKTHYNKCCKKFEDFFSGVQKLLPMPDKVPR